MELNNIIFSFSLLFLGYFLSKYLLSCLRKFKFELLFDNQFHKPQAFHDNSIPRLGGIVIFFLLSLVFLYSFFFNNVFYSEYISFCTIFFLLGLSDDLRLNLAPKFRLMLMMILLMASVILNQFYIEVAGLAFLNSLLEIDIFALFFICLCFLFIINGSNLIDGFNGLLGIHSLVIFIVLLIINFFNGNNNLINILFYIIIIVSIFLIFNFPKSQMFLGDSGAYLIGTLIAISIVNTSILNPQISPFFFCILLFYLFFEVFFSFFRKLFFVGQSPLLPDNKHMHMFFYKILLKKNNKKLNSNYKVSLYINLIYLLLITPGIFLMTNGLFCRYYFLLLLFFYIYFYRILYNKQSID